MTTSYSFLLRIIKRNMGAGCNCIKRDRGDTEEEKGISRIEKLLRFEGFTADTFDCTMRNYSRNHHLS